MFKTLQSYENMKNTNKKFKYFDWKIHTIKKQNIGKSTLACLFLSASHNCVHTFQRGIINLIKIRAVLSIRSPRHNFRKLFKSSDLPAIFALWLHRDKLQRLSFTPLLCGWRTLQGRLCQRKASAPNQQPRNTEAWPGHPRPANTRKAYLNIS